MSTIDSRLSIKWLIALPALLLLLLLPACQNERHLQEPVAPIAECDSFTATLGLQANDLREVTTRATGVENLSDITSLKVLVFDGDYKFLYCSDAVLEKQQTPAPADESAYLPDNKKEGITEMVHFKVTLEKSSSKRHLHFIANHDWSGTTLTVGKSAGELLPSLKPATLTDANPYNRMWSVVTVESLDESTLKDKVVKLLRSYAKLSVELVPSGHGNFVLTEYSIINGMSQGSVVPFTMQNYDYSFSFPPYNATVPATAEVSLSYNWVQADQEALLYEATQESDTPVALIIKGRKKGTSGYGDERYWKIDLVTNKEITNPTNGTNYTVPQTFPILRNRHYVVKISDLVQSNGHATPEEARQAPASNNIFASIELRDFERVSDGTYRLEVSPINKIVCVPMEYDFSVIFAKTTTVATGGEVETPLGDQVQYNLSWDPATDPYLGTFEKSTTVANHFTLKAKQIPTDETKIYTIDILGPRENGQTPIYRKIRLYLRPAFRFNGVLQPATAGSQVRQLEFDVPRDIPATLVPFKVFIQTTDMTPVNDPNDVHKAHLVHIGGKTYYQYTVTEEDQAAGKVVLPFVMHDADTKTKRAVQLSSYFYVTQNLLAESTRYSTTTSHLYYSTPDARKIDLLNSSELSFEFDGKQYDRATLLSEAGILVESLEIGSNEYKIMVEEGYLLDPINKQKQLTIRTHVLKPNVYGYLKYNVENTKTLWDWMQGDTSGHNEATLTTYEVEMVGRLLTWHWIALGPAWNDGAYTGLSNIRVRGYDVDGGAPSDLSRYLTIYANSYQLFNNLGQDGRWGYYYSLVLPKDKIPKRWVHFRNIQIENDVDQQGVYEEWLWERLESITDFAVRYRR